MRYRPIDRFRRVLINGPLEGCTTSTNRKRNARRSRIQSTDRVHLLVGSVVIVCLASLTGHAEVATVAIAEGLAGLPGQARLQTVGPQAGHSEDRSRARAITSPKVNFGAGRALAAWSLRSTLRSGVIRCSAGIAGLHGGSRAPLVEERQQMPRRRVSRLRSRAERTHSAGRAVSSSQLQANRSGESNIPGASAREELAAPPPLRAPPLVASPVG